MYRPNNRCRYYEASEDSDLYGVTASYAAPVSIPCSSIFLDVQVERTSVRADTSGSRGRSEDLQGIARFLFPITHPVKERDIIEFNGNFYEAILIFPRYTVWGALDHYEVDFRKSEPPNG